MCWMQASLWNHGTVSHTQQAVSDKTDRAEKDWFYSMTLPVAEIAYCDGGGK